METFVARTSKTLDKAPGRATTFFLRVLPLLYLLLEELYPELWFGWNCMLEAEDIGYRYFDGLKCHAKNTLKFSNSFGYPSCWQYARTFEFPSIVLSSKCMITFVIRSIVWQTSSDKTLIRVATHCCFLLCFQKNC